jgi:MFS family permease
MGWDEAWAATRRAASAVGSAAHSSSRAGAGAARRTGSVVHRMTSASGAGRTGLASLIELTAAGAAGDAFVTIALAGTLFFNTSLDAARGRVALTLVITMAPFAVLAPIIGPMLDRAKSGRRYLMAGTLLARGLLSYAMVDAVLHNDVIGLLPAAFGVLVLQKAYAVTRASITPRLLPREITLVTANARTGMASLIAGTVAGLLALGVSYVAGGGAEGSAWTLRAATVVYIAAMALSFRVPDYVDLPDPPADTSEASEASEARTVPTPAPTSPAAQARAGRAPAGPAGTVPLSGEYAAQPAGGGNAARTAARGGDPAWGNGPAGNSRRDGPGRGGPGRGGPGRGEAAPGGNGRNGNATGGNGVRRNGNPSRIGLRTLRRLRPVVVEAMRANATLRAFSGFMIFFLAFLLRIVHFHGVNDKVALAAMIVCATAGGFLGSAVGSALRTRRPYLITFGMLLAATVITALCAALWGLWAALVVALIAAFGQVLAKLALDSTVQQEVGEEMRSSVFGVSETLHQLSWVAGGLAGIAMSFTNSGVAGLAVCAVGLGLSLTLLLLQRRHRSLEARHSHPQAVM